MQLPPVPGRSSSKTQVPHALSPEILAMHARLLRPLPSVPDLSESGYAVSSPSNFNSEQGPGPGPRAGLPGPAFLTMRFRSEIVVS